MRALKFVLVALLGLAGCTNYQIQTAIKDPVCTFLWPCAPPPVRTVEKQYTQIQMPPAEAAANAAKEANLQAKLDADARAEANWRRLPHWVTVQKLGPYQGAVVCADMETVDAFTRLRLKYQEDLFRARATGGQSALMRSIPNPPRAEDYGCTVLSAGTRVLADFSNIVPIVRAKIGNHEVVGVTYPAFLKR